MRQAQIKIVVSDASDPQSILVSLICVHLNHHFRVLSLIYTVCAPCIHLVLIECAVDAC